MSRTYLSTRVWKMSDTVTCLLLLCSPIGSFAAEPPYNGKVFVGLGLKAVDLPEDERHTAARGLEITRVAAASSGERAKLRLGDVVVTLDGEEWKGPGIRLSRSFAKDGKRYRPGDIMHLQVSRRNGDDPTDKGELLELDVTLLRYPGTEPEQPRTPTNDELRPDLKDVRPASQALCWQLIDARGFTADCQDLLTRLGRCEEFPDTHRLPICRYVHRDPFKLETVEGEVVEPIAANASGGVAAAAAFLEHTGGLLTTFGRVGDREGASEPERTALPGRDLKSHLAYIETVLEQAAALHAKAFAALSEEDVQFIRDHRIAMLDSYIEVRMLSYDKDDERQHSSVRLLDLAAEVDVGTLLAQARVAAQLVSPQFTTSLLAAVEASGKKLDAAVIARRKTPYGTILVSGRGGRRHTGRGCAVIYDIGGDDVYASSIAASVWGSVPTAVVVDYSGDDAYEAWKPFSQGCGDFGVGLLADLRGDDSYVGVRFAQGVGFCGVGGLFDEAGDDVYRVIDLGQGLGHWGVGMLVDRKGRDRYESHDTSQGVGLPGGLGLLCDGGDGPDSYYCKGKDPSGYGTAGVFRGWGQGMGVGYRPYASGGVGVLFDEAGEDRFEAGNFSQGGGYFYAFGVLHNAGKERDVYIGSRYAQGFGCHQAAGAFIDAGGNDLYTTRLAVAQGLAWDESVGLFIDVEGDDRYEGGGFSQGASAMNGWTIFIDRSGKDTYLYTDQARAGSNTYHDGTSLSFFLDLGGQQDHYPHKTNNSIVTGGERSIFADLPGTVTDALKDDAWRDLLPK